MSKNKEIERKFLVTSDAFISEATDSHHITQGYLCLDPERTIRIRLRDNQAFLTIKSTIDQVGIGRFEWEREIDVDDARQMLKACLPCIIEKTRYIIPANVKGVQGRKWEVDVFHGRLEGRRLAELEMEDENEQYERPEWLGQEVTGQPEYYNSNMVEELLHSEKA
ncbi:MAG: CYTH domain-containing protein [Paludibacteraceae bacterium]|nr:CYTH domain-containing protein [Paludibacteraceae bacterium]